MISNFEMDNDNGRLVTIKVIGVGGGGGNAVNRMIEDGVDGIDFISINTDAQALKSSKAAQRLVIGDKLTKGRGAGGSPEKGQRAAEESKDEITGLVKGTQLVFVAAGMGGGTGTGAAPIVAQAAREQNALTIGVVTKPFEFEGRRRMEQAEMGIAALRDNVDALVVIPNERLRLISDSCVTVKQAFAEADNVLKQGVQSISDLINQEGIINLDFADITEILRGAGYAHMGIGYGSGKNRAEDAAKMAISSPLLESSIDGAERVILNFIGGDDVLLDEVGNAAEMVRSCAHPDVNLIFGITFDESMNDTDEIKMTVIATGFADSQNFDIPDYNYNTVTDISSMLNKDSSSSSEAKEETKPQEDSKDDDDDDNGFDILAIFGKK